MSREMENVVFCLLGALVVIVLMYAALYWI